MADESETVFVPIFQGRGGVNIRHIKRWEAVDNGVEVTVQDLSEIHTYPIYGEDAKRALVALREATA